ncbi:MAG: DinB family protein [Vicinamibacterales bacterium]
MSETADLADLLARVMTGDPWHGSNVESLLDDLTPEEAAARPIAGGHSVWELVLHMTGWAGEVQARLDGRPAGEPPSGDWPTAPTPAAAAWARDRRALVAAHEALAAAIRATDPAELTRPVVDRRDRATGTGQSKYVTLHGLVHHTVYHAGQIAQLRRALRG